MRAGATAAGVLSVLIASLGLAPATHRLEREVFLMGTRVRLVAFAPDRRDAVSGLDRAIETLETADAELSTWRDDSVVSTVNRQPVGATALAPPHLCRTLRILQHWHAQTDGAFDPAIGALVDAWDLHGSGRIPAMDALEQARAGSGFGFVRLAPGEGGCHVTRLRDVRIDVGAWGKGVALDRVRERLPEMSWLIDLGGQIAVNGRPAAAGAWEVSLAAPQARGTAVLDLRLASGSLATSGGSERDLQAGARRIGHILDPRTGHPSAFEGSVSVWHERALVADILSTALHVMGPVDGLSWAESHGIAACYLVPVSDGGIDVRMTGPFRALAADRP
ncbi:MAG: FAD:protein FMN transferase [Acidimicrobiia bacterium]|nr:FAD:protein FMN transferase [Acidimicrobiia bacterium]